MSDEPRTELGRYVRWLANELGLRDWHIVLAGGDDPPDNRDHAACITVYYGRKRARIRLSREWDGMSPEDQRHCLVHELLHAHVDPMRTALSNAASTLGDAAYGILKGAHDDALELAVDGIADAIAPYLPLPDAEANEQPEVAA